MHIFIVCCYCGAHVSYLTIYMHFIYVSFWVNDRSSQSIKKVFWLPLIHIICLYIVQLWILINNFNRKYEWVNNISFEMDFPWILNLSQRRKIQKSKYRTDGFYLHQIDKNILMSIYFYKWESLQMMLLPNAKYKLNSEYQIGKRFYHTFFL